MSQISFRVDNAVKKSAEQVCAEIGISMSAALNIYFVNFRTKCKLYAEISIYKGNRKIAMPFFVLKNTEFWGFIIVFCNDHLSFSIRRKMAKYMI